MNATNNAQQRALLNQQSGTFDSRGERLDWTYYDSQDLAVAVTEFTLFQAGLGTAGKTLADTNMPQNGQIPQGQKFKIHNISVFLSTPRLASADIVSLNTLLMETSTEFQIVNKRPMGQWTLAQLMGAPLLAPLTPAVAGDNEPFSSVGRFVGVYPINVPITLAALTPFGVKVVHHTAVAAALATTVLRVCLNGVLSAQS